MLLKMFKIIIHGKIFKHMKNETDIWQEGSDSRECEDCGRTSHSCTCYKEPCSYCEEFITTPMMVTWDGLSFCQGDCLDFYLNDIKSLERDESDL